MDMSEVFVLALLCLMVSGLFKLCKHDLKVDKTHSPGPRKKPPTGRLRTVCTDLGPMPGQRSTNTKQTNGKQVEFSKRNIQNRKTQNEQIPQKGHGSKNCPTVACLGLSYESYASRSHW